MTKIILLGTKRRFPNLQDQERRTMHPKSTRFRVHDLILCLRRRLKTPVRIEEDHRSDIQGGPVTLRLGNSPNSPLIVVRTIPDAAPVNGNTPPGESSFTISRSRVVRSNGGFSPDAFLVHSAAFEHCPELRALNRYTVDELVDHLKASSPKIVEEVAGQENTRAA